MRSGVRVSFSGSSCRRSVSCRRNLFQVNRDAVVVEWMRSLPAESGPCKLGGAPCQLMSMPGVVGMAEGKCAGHPCILVLVDRLTPALRKTIPSELEGIPVEIRETDRPDARS